MAQRSRFNFLDGMRFADRLKLGAAVALMFGTLGPLIVLADPGVEMPSWMFAVVIGAISGLFSSGFIVFGPQFHKRKWLSPLYVALFLFLLTQPDRITCWITGEQVHPQRTISEPVMMNPAEFQNARVRRTELVVLSAAMLGLGWVLFTILFTLEGKRRVRLQTEVRIAQEIQRSLLPSGPVTGSWFTVNGASVNAEEVGGDFYDVVELPDARVAVIIADASGHGIGSGILSAMTKSAMYNQLTHDATPSRLLEQLNATLVRMTSNRTFITCAYLLLDRNTQTIALSTAGHLPVLLNVNGQVQELRTPNLALGVARDRSFMELQVPIVEGMELLLYTDGIVEAANDKGEEFGLDRLKRSFAGNFTEPVAGRILAEVRSYSGREQFGDDATVVHIRLNGEMVLRDPSKGSIS